jgi:hypothetical protein
MSFVSALASLAVPFDIPLGIWARPAEPLLTGSGTRHWDRISLVHAGRVLDTFLRRRAEPALVARYFGEIEFSEPFTDALGAGRFGGADAASPASLTRDTFVFHALGSLIGDAPVANYLEDSEIAAVAASAQRSEGDPGTVVHLT